MNRILNQIADDIAGLQRPGQDRFSSIRISASTATALGSALALLLALRRAGLRVRLFLDEPIPDRLSFLPHLDLIEPYDAIICCGSCCRPDPGCGCRLFRRRPGWPAPGPVRPCATELPCWIIMFRAANPADCADRRFCRCRRRNRL